MQNFGSVFMAISVHDFYSVDDENVFNFVSSATLKPYPALWNKIAPGATVVTLGPCEFRASVAGLSEEGLALIEQRIMEWNKDANKTQPVRRGFEVTGRNERRPFIYARFSISNGENRWKTYQDFPMRRLFRDEAWEENLARGVDLLLNNNPVEKKKRCVFKGFMHYSREVVDDVLKAYEVPPVTKETAAWVNINDGDLGVVVYCASEEERQSYLKKGGSFVHGSVLIEPVNLPLDQLQLGRRVFKKLNEIPISDAQADFNKILEDISAERAYDRPKDVLAHSQEQEQLQRAERVVELTSGSEAETDSDGFQLASNRRSRRRRNNGAEERRSQRISASRDFFNRTPFAS